MCCQCPIVNKIWVLWDLQINIFCFICISQCINYLQNQWKICNSWLKSKFVFEISHKSLLKAHGKSLEISFFTFITFLCLYEWWSVQRLLCVALYYRSFCASEIKNNFEFHSSQCRIPIDSFGEGICPGWAPSVKVVRVCVCTLKVHGYIVSFTGLHAVLLGGLGEHQDKHTPAYSFKCQFEIPTPADKEWKGKSKAFQMPLAKTLTTCEMHLFHIL